MKGSKSLFVLLLTAFAIAGFAETASAASAAVVSSPFRYWFHVTGTLYETSSSGESTSPYWWLNSGAKLRIEDGVGKTVQGNLPANDKWRLLYARTNPLDTDNGYHPQNLFRLVTRSIWGNVREEAYFKVNKDNLSSSPNRDGHNGLLLMSRYQDSGQTLYYTGVRVDGAAVIKRKFKGSYTTLASKKILSNSLGSYDKVRNPNLIPKNTWVGIRSEVKDNADGSANVRLYTDVGQKGIWTLALEVRDTSPIRTSGYGGIRTDFMDVEFDEYRLTAI